MNDGENYDELSIADIVRRVWRQWYVVVAGVLIGVGVAWLTTDGGSTSSTSREVNLGFVDYTGTAEALDLPPAVAEPPVPSEEIATVNQIATDLDLGGASVSVTAIDSQDTLRIVVTAESEEEATEAADAVVAAYREERVEQVTSALAVVGEFAENEVEILTERRDALLADLGDGANPGIETELLVINEDLNDAQSKVRAAERLSRLIAERLITEGSATTTTSAAERSSRVVLAGGLLGAVAGFSVLTVLAIIDRKVRRRQQVARLLPGVPLLGVFGREPLHEDGQLTLFEAALRRRLASLGCDHVDVRGVGPGTFAERLGEVVPTAGATAAIVLACSYGRASEDELTASAQALALAGQPIAGTVLGDVPDNERTWAAAGFEPTAGDERSDPAARSENRRSVQPRP